MSFYLKKIPIILLLLTIISCDVLDSDKDETVNVDFLLKN